MRDNSQIVRKNLFLKNLREIFCFFLNDNEPCLFLALFSQLLQSNRTCKGGQDVAERRLCKKKKFSKQQRRQIIRKNTYWPDGRRSVEVVFFCVSSFKITIISA